MKARAVVLSSVLNIGSGVRCISACVRDKRVPLEKRLQLRRSLQELFKTKDGAFVEEFNGHLLAYVLLPATTPSKEVHKLVATLGEELSRNNLLHRNRPRLSLIA